jgi:hypothetical protein
MVKCCCHRTILCSHALLATETRQRTGGRHSGTEPTACGACRTNNKARSLEHGQLRKNRRGETGEVAIFETGWIFHPKTDETAGMDRCGVILR